MNNHPVAVLISDIHYSIPTLALADAAMRQAIKKANDLDVPLIIAGDLHDTKANMRAECVNAMIETFSQCMLEPIVLIGNHDRINEKSEAHSLNFLTTYFKITKIKCLELPEGDKIYCAGYYHDPEELRKDLAIIPKGSTIVMHQGLQSALAGDYIQDRSAITHDDVKYFRVISGHYHTRQDIKTGRPQKGAVGLFSYIGNPYTLNFAEANDPPKGFQILMDDGTLKFVPTNLRKHDVLKLHALDAIKCRGCIPPQNDDLMLLKVHGTKEQLAQVTKDKIRANIIGLTGEFKLELIETPSAVSKQDTKKDLSQEDTLDAMIDSLTNTSDEKKARLKELWKSYCN